MPYQFHLTLLGVLMKKLALLVSMLPSMLYAGDLVVLDCTGTALSDETEVEFVFTVDTADETIKDSHGVSYGVHDWKENDVSFGLKDSTNADGEPLMWDAERINTRIRIWRESGDMMIVNGRETTHKGSCEARRTRLF